MTNKGFLMKEGLLFLLPSLMTGMLFADSTTASSRSGSVQQMLIMGGVARVFFYLVLLRPEQKRRKKLNELRKNLSKGDKVTLTSGILGTVAQIKESTVLVQMTDGAKIEVLKGAIAETGMTSEKTKNGKAFSISEASPTKADS